MDRYSLGQLTDGVLLTGLKSNLARERDCLALVLAHIGEVEARELFRPAGYSSMHMYCVHELKLSKDAAYKRLTAARLARQFPAIFDRVAEGALRLNALNILSPHVDLDNADELLSTSAFRSDFEVREILAERSPQASVPTTIEPIAEQTALASPQESVSEHAGLAAQRVQRDVSSLRVQPIAADLYKATFTMSRALRDKLRRAKDLLGHRKSVPDEAEILEAGVDLFIAQIEKRKFGSADQPRRARRSRSAAHVSVATRREVRDRDGSQCTFTSDTGVRCPETKGLEFDHIQPVARGGDSRASNLRLRCRAHNQLEAERVFGKPFMRHQRDQAKAKAAAARPEVETCEWTARFEGTRDEDVAAWLRSMGYSAEEAGFAVAECPPRPSVLLGTRRLTCLQFLRDKERLTAAGT